MQKFIITTLILVLIVVGFLLFTNKASAPTATTDQTPETTTPINTSSETDFDGTNTSFTLDGESVTLVDGVYEKPAAPGSASVETVRYFGNEAYGDLNFDGVDDVAFLVTKETGGSGFFFYAVAGINVNGNYKMTNAFFVGDRIAPQNTEISSAGELRINYATQAEDEPMTTPPSRAVTLFLKVTPDYVLEGLME